MASSTFDPAPHPVGAVFLSYAREDSAAASRIADALRAFGVEVWFDRSELRGGDAWDQKIRNQIRACTLFLPVISAQTQARPEGYFRREWKLAVERTHDMTAGLAFIVPVVIDDTRETEADVPEEFMRYQWTRLAHGVPSPQFVDQIKSLSESPRSATRTPKTAGAGAESAQRGERATPLAAPSTSRRVALTVAGIALAVVCVALLLTWRGTKVPETPPNAHLATSAGASAKLEAPRAADRSIAVLAFSDLSAEKDGEYFSDGISEELLNVLAKVPGLRVAARTSAFSFKGRNVPIPEIAKTLNVAYVVEGSVRKAAGRVRITAQLISAADGFHVWSDNFDRELKDIFAVQDEIAGVIAQNLQLKLGGVRRVARIVNPEAHRLALEGWHYWNLRTEESFAMAEAAFTRSLQIDPDFATAHAGLADVELMRDVYRMLDGWSNALRDPQRIRAAAERALQLDPSLAEPHGVLAHLLFEQGQFAAAHEEYRRAFELNPNYAAGHLRRAVLLEREGRFDVSMREYEETIRLDPLWAVAITSYSRQVAQFGRPEEGLKLNDRGAKLWTGVFLPHVGYRASILWTLGRRDEAVEAARSLHRAPASAAPRWNADALAIWVLHEARLAEAGEYANEFLPRLPPDSYMRGFVLAAVGRFEEALPFLERTPLDSVNCLYSDAMWDPWRNDPRFLQLMAKLGRTEEYKAARATLARMRKEQAAKQ